MKKLRARDLGIPFEGATGEFNAVTELIWAGLMLMAGEYAEYRILSRL